MGELSGQFAICASQGTRIPHAPIRRMRAIYLDGTGGGVPVEQV